MFNDILWRFLILETFVLGALCSNRCVKKHRQTWFCTSDLVVTGIFHEVNNPPDTGGYVEIKEVFKGDVRGVNIEDNGYVRFETPTYVNFLDGMKYLIAGRNKNGRIYSDMCIKDMELFTKYGYFFKKASKIGCDCMDEIGKYRYDNNVCEWAHSYMKMFGKNCKWVQNRNFKFCQKVWGGEEMKTEYTRLENWNSCQ